MTTEYYLVMHNAGNVHLRNVTVTSTLLDIHCSPGSNVSQWAPTDLISCTGLLNLTTALDAPAGNDIINVTAVTGPVYAPRAFDWTAQLPTTPGLASPLVAAYIHALECGWMANQRELLHYSCHAR